MDLVMRFFPASQVDEEWKEANEFEVEELKRLWDVQNAVLAQDHSHDHSHSHAQGHDHSH
jgi:ABC-type nickel/cobalt efflux system permease component RcnA